MKAVFGRGVAYSEQAITTCVDLNKWNKDRKGPHLSHISSFFLAIYHLAPTFQNPLPKKHLIHLKRSNMRNSQPFSSKDLDQVFSH